MPNLAIADQGGAAHRAEGPAPSHGPRGAARSPANFDDRIIRGRDNRSVALFSYWALWVSEDDVTVYAYKMKHQARFGTGVMPGTG